MKKMIYDVVIIGGGPAGMMAATRASDRGARVLLLEKNDILGLKFLATGHGRSNLTNLTADDKQTIFKYGPNSKFLYSCFSKFGVASTLEFFHNLGVATKVEDRGRVFPQSDKARDVLQALTDLLLCNKVELKTEASVKEIKAKNNKIVKAVLENGEEIFGKNFIIATGGKSYPSTGSTGDAYAWLIKLGHKINTPRPALTSVVVREKFVKELEGLSLNNVKLSIWQKQKKIVSQTGDMIFTADGISGPLVIDLSSQIGALLSSPVSIQLDFRNDVEKEKLEQEIQKDFHSSNNKIFKNYLADLVPPKFVPIFLRLTGISEDKRVNTISKTERQALVGVLKELTLTVDRLKGFEKAMVTAGGVDTKEVDPKTMSSRLYSNLFLAGEILDLDGPTGGYNLQICWSTGFVAGDSVIF